MSPFGSLGTTLWDARDGWNVVFSTELPSLWDEKQNATNLASLSKHLEIQKNTLPLRRNFKTK
jgi:hypothetical protein